MINKKLMIWQWADGNRKSTAILRLKLITKSVRGRQWPRKYKKTPPTVKS